MRLLPFIVGLAVTAVLVPFATGCGTADSQAAADDRPVVATTVPPHAWLVRRIAGDEVRVLVALSGIASCHDHAPPDAAVTALSGADLYLRAGIGAERGPWLTAVTRAGKMPVVDLLAAARAGLPEDLAADIGADPHAWTSPASLRRQAAAITNAMIEQWPDRAEAFRTGLAALDRDLAAAEQTVDERLAAVRGGTIVVDHPAWAWLAAENGIRQIAVVPEPGATSDFSLEEIRTLMRDEQLGTVVIQPQHDPRASRALAESVGAELVSLDPMAADPMAAIMSAVDIFERIATPAASTS